MSRRAAGCVLGSPPRVRGTPTKWGCTEATIGLTPAGAGNTSPQRRAHPRGCGEPKWPSAPCRSPPPQVHETQRAHPRGCGEHLGMAGSVNTSMGSPPRVRGTLHEVVRSEGLAGLTPAGAGNTRSPPTRGSVGRAHPRECGEHLLGDVNPVIALGSPPRVRGTLVRAGRQPCGEGLTPASAGNTVWHHFCARRHWAHPRECGEHSPARGGDVHESGLTPASAGNTRGGQS